VVYANCPPSTEALIERVQENKKNGIRPLHTFADSTKLQILPPKHAQITVSKFTTIKPFLKHAYM
jgi:hypothetical protein